MGSTVRGETAVGVVVIAEVGEESLVSGVVLARRMGEHAISVGASAESGGGGRVRAGLQYRTGAGPTVLMHVGGVEVAQ
ncbi:hypothetical protein [Nocardia rhamnosiphila]